MNHDCSDIPRSKARSDMSGIEVDDGWNKSMSEVPGQSGHALPAL